MRIIRWIGSITLVILGLGILLGAGAFIIGGIVVVSIASAGAFGIFFLAFCIQEWWRTRKKHR